MQKIRIVRKPSQKEVTIIPERHEVFVRGKRVHVPRAELTLLLALKESNVTMSRKDLLKLLWKNSSAFAIDSRTVDQHIARLRKRLKTNIVETVQGFGYRYANV